MFKFTNIIKERDELDSLTIETRYLLKLIEKKISETFGNESHPYQYCKSINSIIIEDIQEKNWYNYKFLELTVSLEYPEPVRGNKRIQTQHRRDIKEIWEVFLEETVEQYPLITKEMALNFKPDSIIKITLTELFDRESINVPRGKVY